MLFLFAIPWQIDSSKYSTTKWGKSDDNWNAGQAGLGECP